MSEYENAQQEGWVNPEEGEQPTADTQTAEEPQPRKPGIFGNSADLTDEEKEELVAAGFDIPKPIESSSESGDNQNSE